MKWPGTQPCSKALTSSECQRQIGRFCFQRTKQIWQLGRGVQFFCTLWQPLRDTCTLASKTERIIQLLLALKSNDALKIWTDYNDLAMALMQQVQKKSLKVGCSACDPEPCPEGGAGVPVGVAPPELEGAVGEEGAKLQVWPLTQFKLSPKKNYTLNSMYIICSVFMPLLETETQPHV